MLGVLGAAYQSASIISAHTRNQNDPINHAVGGFAAGLLGGCARKIQVFYSRSSHVCRWHFWPRFILWSNRWLFSCNDYRNL